MPYQIFPNKKETGEKTCFQSSKKSTWICLILWILAGIIYPVWIGRMYALNGPNGSYRSGVFGFRETGNIYIREPIWSPPKLSRDSIRIPILWPWERPYRQMHIELYLPGIFAQWAVGIIVLGFAYLVAGSAKKEDKPDPLLTFAWVIALYLGIGMVAIFGLGVLSMGYAPVDDYMVVLFSLGALGTFFYFVYFKFKKSPNPNTPDVASLPVSPTG